MISRVTVPELILKNVEDVIIRENFFRLQKFLNDFPLFKGSWKFFELTFDAAVTNKQILHGLGFIPLDVIQTSVRGAGTLTWDYDLFDRDYLVVTTTGACTIRAFVGAYREN